MKPHIEKLLDHACTLGESPLWDVRRNILCWVDIEEGRIHQYDETAQKLTTFSVGQQLGSITICRNGNFLGAMKNGFGFVDRVTGVLTMAVNPELHLPGNRFNEGKSDPAGRFWAGTMALAEDSPAGSVYMLKPDMSFVQKISDVTISNGMAWSLDHKTFYYIDTPTFQVVAFDYDKATGEIANKRTAISIASQDGYPDGMTIDNEGMLWIAHWDGWQVTRRDPATGKTLLTIKMPLARVTSCMFGGAHFEDLYITSARRDLSPAELKKQPDAGCVFVIRKCGYKGVPVFEFDN